MTKLKVSTKAYCKMILHAAKYPHCAINGLLLAKSSSGKDIEFVDAVPLFHIALNLTPMAEIALTQVDAVAADDDLIIAGYYTANEHVDDNDIERVQHRISDKIADNFSHACIILIDNSALSKNLKDHSLKASQYSDGKYKKLADCDLSLMEDDAQAVTAQLMNDLQICERLVDFDNHLDDIKLDWMNLHINKEIELALNNC